MGLKDPPFESARINESTWVMSTNYFMIKGQMRGAHANFPESICLCVSLVDGYAKGPTLIKSVLFQDGCKQGFVCAVADEFRAVDCSDAAPGQQIMGFG